MALPIGDGYASIGSCGEASVNSTQTATDATYSPISRGIVVGTAGDLAVTMAWGTTSMVIPALPAGWHPLRVKAIHATGSAAQAVTVFW